MVARIGKAADGIGPRLWRYSDEADGDAAQVTVTDAQVMIVGSPAMKTDPTRIAAAMTALLQLQLDIRYPITDLDPDDPVRLADPATARVFWDGSDVVERPAVVTVTHDGTDYVTHIRGLG